MNKIMCGDCLEVMPTLPENSVDSVICDPPYGLDFMGKEWDHGIPGVEFWQAALRVAKPGAILMAFGGTRTFHRLACAIEDAGWEMHDTMCWLYGSGFPKSLDISKQIDRRGGAQVAWFGPWFRRWREEQNITQKEVAALFPSKSGGMTGCVANWELRLNMPTPEQFNLLCKAYGLPFNSIEEAEREVVGMRESGLYCGTGNSVSFGIGRDRQTVDITAPATPAARLWQGYGTGLKPAWEPIIVAMKPLEGTYAENAQKWGVAGLNIDGSRIGYEKDPQNAASNPLFRKENGYKNKQMCDAGGSSYSLRHEEGETERIVNSQGRWPANLLLDEEAARLLDEQSGELSSEKRTELLGNRGATGIYGDYGGALHKSPMHPGSGGASRFFYTAKASSSERNAGLEGMAIGQTVGGGGLNNTPDDVCGKYGSIKAPQQNIHPTVKPVDLMRYLCRLTKTPTGGVVLDPFMGSGTTGIACVLEHRDFIGIEIDKEYAEIARKRIADMTGPLFEKVADG